MTGTTQVPAATPAYSFVPPPPSPSPAPLSPGEVGSTGVMESNSQRAVKRHRDSPDAPYRLMLVTDTYSPQVNGVVTTIKNLIVHCRTLGFDVEVIEPSSFLNVGFPIYPEVRLCVNIWHVGILLCKFRPDAVHIFTEGPLGTAARVFCGGRNIPFTTSYHTRFPEYLHALVGLPVSVSYPFLRWFHTEAETCLVPTPTVRKELDKRFDGATTLVNWTRGVDISTFDLALRTGEAWRENEDLVRFKATGQKILLWVGRISREKNVEEFCRLDNGLGIKVLVGDGPIRSKMEAKYASSVHFAGFKRGRDLALYYAAADVFVFTSKTDTFGNVMIEAMSCGTPVAAFPVTGPIDVVEHGVTGFIHAKTDPDESDGSQLARSILSCLSMTPSSVAARCREVWTLETMGRIFVDNLVLVDKPAERFRMRRKRHKINYWTALLALIIYRMYMDSASPHATLTNGPGGASAAAVTGPTSDAGKGLQKQAEPGSKEQEASQSLWSVWSSVIMTLYLLSTIPSLHEVGK